MASTEIPVIDFSSYGLGVSDPSKVDPKVVQSLADTVWDALTNFGFCYIKKHGIPKDQVEMLMNTSKEFYHLPEATKQKYVKAEGDYHGWLPLECESLDPSRPGDCKESYTYTPPEGVSSWPSEVPEFEKSMKTYFQSCEQFASRIFDLMSLGLKLEDKEFFKKCHSKTGQKGNPTSVRLYYYPSHVHGHELEPGQMQGGEHTDYGTFTMIFQDNVGGLQFRNRKGEFIDAKPMDDTIIMYMGSLTQRWAADKVISPVHRVIIPDERRTQDAVRWSLAYYVQPDDGVMVRCLDGSDKYEPISSDEYLKQRFDATF